MATWLQAENRDPIAVIQNPRPFLPDRIVSAMTGSLAIIGAIETRDADAAVRAVNDHLESTLRRCGLDI